MNLGFSTASQVVQWKRNCLSIQETQETCVQSFGWEDPLELEMATHFSILAWKIPWTEEPDGLYIYRGFREADMTELTRTHV